MSQTEVLNAINAAVNSNNTEQSVKNFFFRYNFFHIRDINLELNTSDFWSFIKFFDILFQLHNNNTKFHISVNDFEIALKQILKYTEKYVEYLDCDIFLTPEVNVLLTIFLYLKYVINKNPRSDIFIIKTAILISYLIQQKEKTFNYYDKVAIFFGDFLLVLPRKVIYESKLWESIKISYDFCINIGKNICDLDTFNEYIFNAITKLSMNIIIYLKSIKRSFRSLIEEQEQVLIQLIDTFSELLTQAMSTLIYNIKYTSNIGLLYLKLANSVWDVVKHLKSQDQDFYSYIINLVAGGFFNTIVELRYDSECRSNSNNLIVKIMLVLIKKEFYINQYNDFEMIEESLNSNLIFILDKLPIDCTQYFKIFRKKKITLELKLLSLYFIYFTICFSMSYQTTIANEGDRFYVPFDEFVLDLSTNKIQIDLNAFTCLFLIHVIRYYYVSSSIDWTNTNNLFFLQHLKLSPFQIQFLSHPSMLKWVLTNPMLTKQEIQWLWFYEYLKKSDYTLEIFLTCKPQLFDYFFEYFMETNDQQLLNIIGNVIKQAEEMSIFIIWYIFWWEINSNQQYLLNNGLLYLVNVLIQKMPIYSIVPIDPILNHVKYFEFNLKDINSFMIDVNFILILLDITMNQRQNIEILQSIINFKKMTNNIFECIWNTNNDYIRNIAFNAILKLQNYQNFHLIHCTEPYIVKNVLKNTSKNEKLSENFITFMNNSFNSIEMNILPLIYITHCDNLYNILVSTIEFTKLNFTNNSFWLCLSRILQLIIPEYLASFVINEPFFYLIKFIVDNQLYNDVQLDNFLYYYIGIVETQFISDSYYEEPIRKYLQTIIDNELNNF